VVDVFARGAFASRDEVVTEGPRFEQAITFYRGRGTRTEINGERRINGAIFVRVERARPLVSPAYDLGEDDAQITARQRAARAASSLANSMPVVCWAARHPEVTTGSRMFG
jgi:hypothetical protein